MGTANKNKKNKKILLCKKWNHALMLMFTCDLFRFGVI